MRRDTMDNVEPINMSYEQLKEITNEFSDDCVVGRGTYGVVYKGVDKDGKIIAVKKLNNLQGVDDMEFPREFNNLTKLKHKNIVPFLGFCNESELVPVEHQGKNVIADMRHRVLCFEYMKNGSLQNHLNEEHQGFEWQARYKIIKGVCEGLKHLHTGLERPVLHLDLKPENILLDNNMEPKIADFGLSRLISTANTIKTIHFFGTLGYCPPEFVQYQIISPKFDIFSLGVVIIKILCGTDGYSRFHDKKPDRFKKNVLQNWKERLGAKEGYASLDRDCQQVNKCLIIALKCLAPERENRPDIEYIVNQLYETEKYTNSVPYGMEQMTSLVKVGLWGGLGGSPHDINTLPQRLTSWTIRSDVAIHSIEFTYIDINGEDCNSGHWGGTGGGTPKKIELGHGEYVMEVSGTNGPYTAQVNQITSLNIITNACTYSYGQPKGTSFRIPVENGQIVGFYARSGLCLDAIGLYILP